MFGVDREDGVVRVLSDRLKPSPDLIGLAFRPPLFDDVSNPVRQHDVLVGPALLLKVPRDAGCDRIARHFLASFSGKQNEREVGIRSADRLEELDTVLPRHIVIGDDTVERGLTEPVNAVPGARHRLDVEPFVLTSEVHGH